MKKTIILLLSLFLSFTTITAFANNADKLRSRLSHDMSNIVANQLELLSSGKIKEPSQELRDTVKQALQCAFDQGFNNVPDEVVIKNPVAQKNIFFPSKELANYMFQDKVKEKIKSKCYQYVEKAGEIEPQLKLASNKALAKQKFDRFLDKNFKKMRRGGLNL